MSTTTADAIRTINPATGEEIGRYPRFTESQIDRTLDRAVAAQRDWRRTSFAERSAPMKRAAAHLRAEKRRIAEIATREMGKTIAEAEAEVEKCATCCEHYADHAPSYLADEDHASSATRSYVAYRPLGVVLAIMPWNFPYWQVFRFAAPALMAGNAGVLKHAANVTECALEIERVLAAAGFPQGLFATIVVGGNDMGRVVADPRIAAVTLTGSEGAGSAVAATAGKHLKKTVLELGGSDAFIVLGDADVAAAAKTAVRARFQNAGQSCIAAKRFIVEAPVYDAFLAAFARGTKALLVGDPMNPESQMGPLARADLRDDLTRQVRATLEAGGRLVTGGNARPGAAPFFEPTIVADVVPGMTLFDEETFGPVAAVVRARDERHAIELANNSRYGLGGNLWTRDIARAERIAGELESGAVFINGITSSDPRLPFGGVKLSGYGRELSSFGIREFVNIQTVWIGPSQDAAAQAGPASE